MTVSGPTVDSPNWVLVLVCGIVSLTAVGAAIGVPHAIPTGTATWWDLPGYVALAISTALFALQAAISPRRPELGERLQIPAVYLTVFGVFMLLMSRSAGPRL